MAGRPISTFEFMGHVNVLTNGAGAVTLYNHSGVTVPANSTGAGDISITTPPCDATETMCILMGKTTLAGAAVAAPTVVHTSDTAKQLLLWTTAGAAVDGVVSATFFKINPFSGGGSLGTQVISTGARGTCGQSLQFIGGGIITTNGGGAPTVVRNDGFTVPALGAGVGDLTVVCDPVDERECFTVLWAQSATVLVPAIVHTSDTQKQILLSDSAAAADGTFGLYLFRVLGMSP